MPVEHEISEVSSPLVSICLGAFGQPSREPIPLASIIEAIKNGAAPQWKEPALEIQQIAQDAHGKSFEQIKELVEEKKKKLWAIMGSGVFSKRGNKNCTTYSHCLIADFDHLTPPMLADVRAKAESDPFLCCGFASVTHTGYKAVFRVAGGIEKHRQNFKAVVKHCREYYQVAPDEAAKNEERLCYISNDPDAILWRESKALEPIDEAPREKVRRKTVESPAPGRRADLTAKQLEIRRGIAEELLGEIRWQSGDTGYCPCPNKGQHTGADAERDCRIKVDGAATLFCLHDHCQPGGGLDNANHELRSRIGRAERDFIILPSAHVSLSDGARDIFSRATGLYFRGGTVTELVQEDDIARLAIVGPDAFRTRVERVGKVVAWRQGRKGEPVLAPAHMSGDCARAILVSKDASESLPPVASVLRCPVLVEKDGALDAVAKGYQPDLGGLLIERGELPPKVEVEEAVASLLELYAEYDFASSGDKSRALADVITPALRLAGFLKGPVPISIAESDRSQAGKGLRHSLTCAIYGEKSYHIGQRDGGVGSADESFAAALIAGRPFICLDNWRGKLDSPYLEMFLTCPGLFPARIPHRQEIMVDPRRFILQFTSNGAESTRDLANRANLCRVRKREGRAFVDILAKVQARPEYYLGCVFAVCGAWWEAGKPRTSDTRHDFQEWAQVLDWIIQNVFKLAPLMDGHREAQARMSDPAQVWLRATCLALEQGNELGTAFGARQLAEKCEAGAVAVPGWRTGDILSAARIIGGMMKRLFGREKAIELEGFTVELGERSYRVKDNTGDHLKWMPTYTFDAPQFKAVKPLADVRTQGT